MGSQFPGFDFFAVYKGSVGGFEIRDGRIVSKTGRNGGVLGGITDGSPVVFRFSVKPTPSILKEQSSVDLRTMKDTKLRTEGRFDANFTPRILVIAEALSLIITADHLMISGHIPHDSLIEEKERLRYGITGGQEGVSKECFKLSY